MNNIELKVKIYACLLLVALTACNGGDISYLDYQPKNSKAFLKEIPQALEGRWFFEGENNERVEIIILVKDNDKAELFISRIDEKLKPYNELDRIIPKAKIDLEKEQIIFNHFDSFHIPVAMGILDKICEAKIIAIEDHKFVINILRFKHAPVDIWTTYIVELVENKRADLFSYRYDKLKIQLSSFKKDEYSKDSLHYQNMVDKMIFTPSDDGWFSNDAITIDANDSQFYELMNSDLLESITLKRINTFGALDDFYLEEKKN